MPDVSDEALRLTRPNRTCRADRASRHGITKGILASATSITASESVGRRLLNRAEAARYLGDVSLDTVDRLINRGELPIVRLPVQRSRTHTAGVAGINRRILIDVCDLDTLIEKSKETRG